jgi:hypothetical protein
MSSVLALVYLCVKTNLMRRRLRLLPAFATQFFRSLRDLHLEKPSSSAANRRFVTKASSAAIGHYFPIVLGDVAAVLAGMEADVDSGPARRSMAPSAIQAVLDVALGALCSPGRNGAQSWPLAGSDQRALLALRFFALGAFAARGSSRN